MSLRPDRFTDIIGQDKAIEGLGISIKSANVRNAALGHVLIDAQPGLGKSTISAAIANELGVDNKVVLGGNIHSFKDILPTIMDMKFREVLFIDEIHRVNKRIAESFYTILEDFRVDIPVPVSKGNTKLASIELPEFTVVGATTEAGSLPKPFRDRFKHKYTLKLYNNIDLEKIITFNAQKLNITMSSEAMSFVTKISRGTPRIANANLEWLRDYQLARKIPELSVEDVVSAMSVQGIDSDGLTENDRSYLLALRKNNSPVGIQTLSSITGIDRETIESIIEPFLLTKFLISKTSKGRVAI